MVETHPRKGGSRLGGGGELDCARGDGGDMLNSEFGKREGNAKSRMAVYLEKDEIDRRIA